MRYLLFLLIMISCPVIGQDIVILTLDSQTKQPVQNANICIKPVHGRNKVSISTDSAGRVVFSASGTIVISVSSIGYITKLDTVSKGSTKTILLQPKAYDFDEVVITGQYKPVQADRSIYKINIINNRQIEEKAATNLSDLLATELNFRVLQDGSLGSNLSLQGLSGEHVKILVDGIPVIGRQNGILDLSQINLSNIDRIEIVEGPMSVIYGSNALAGVLNLITRKQNNGKLRGNINSYYETAGSYNFDGSFTANFKSNSITLNGGRNFFDGFTRSDSIRVKDWKPKEQFFAGFNYIYSGKKLKVQLDLDFFKEKLLNEGKLDSSVISETKTLPSGIDSTLLFINYRAIDQYHYTIRFNQKGLLQYCFSPTSKIETTLSNSFYRKIKNTFKKDFADLSETMADSSAQDTSTFNNIVSRTIYNNSSQSWMEYMTGLDLNIETATGKRINGEKRIDDYAFFASVKLFPQKKINAQAGVRAIYNSKFSAPLIYSLNLKYSPLDYTTFRVSYGKGFRAPSLKELYLQFQDINHHVFGNENLKAETSHNFNLSATSSFFPQKLHIKLDVNLFYNIIRNKIDFVYDADNPTWAMYFNISEGDYVTKGYEIKSNFNFHPAFSFISGVNFLSCSRISDLDKYFNSTDYILSLSYKNQKWGLKISAFYKYTDDLYTSKMKMDKVDEEPKIYDGWMSGYHTLNITVSQPFFKNRLLVSAGAKNLFDYSGVASYGTNTNVHGGSDGETLVGWGRTYFVRLTYNFVLN